MSESSENSEAHSASEAQRKLAQHHLERIKKEEEEEQWISGEELYTEGSSDEDDAALRAKRRGKAARKNRRATPSKDVKQKKQQPMMEPVASLETPTTSKSSNHVDNPESVLDTLTSEPKLESLNLSDEGMASPNKPEPSTSSGLQAEVDHAQISWRPKRGSIKLPNINPEDDNGEIVKKINKHCNWTLSDMLEIMNEPQESASSSTYEIFRTVEAFYISGAQSDQSRPQKQKPCHGETLDLQSAFLEMEKYDNLLEFMAKKEREARETTNKLMLHVKNKLIELNESQKLSGQLAKNIKSFVQLHTEKTNCQEKSLALPNVNGDNTKRSAVASITVKDHFKGIKMPQKCIDHRPQTAGDERAKKSTLIGRVQSAVTEKRREINFIQRNIESVSANVEELTDEEKQQLAVLLTDIEHMKEERASSGDTVSASLLFSRKIDVKAAETSIIRKTRSSELMGNVDSDTGFIILTQEENEKVKHLLGEQETDHKYKYPTSDLMDIDKALTALQTSALEEVEPIDEDAIKGLIAGYYKENSVSSQDSVKAMDQDSKFDFPNENHPQELPEGEYHSSDKWILDTETLKKLLNQAYKDLPNFKYRYV